MASPFTHKFQSYNGNYYIYDVHTNRILHVDHTVYTIIDDYLELSESEILSKYSSEFETAKIKTAFASLNTQYRNGLFSEHRPMKMVPRHSENELLANLAAKIEYLLINITETCNLRCRYCSYGGTYVYERTHSSNSMKKEIIEKALSFFVEHSTETEEPAISIYGGEPLTVYNSIVQAARFLKDLKSSKKYRLVIITNGVLLDDKIVDFVSENNIHLQVSLDGPPPMHDQYRVDARNQPTFEKIMTNLESLKKRNEQLYNQMSFACTFCPSSNLLEINDFFENNRLTKGHLVSASLVDLRDTEFVKNFTKRDFTQLTEQVNTLRVRYMNARINNQEPTCFEKALFDKHLIQMHRRDFSRLGDAIGTNGCCMPGVRKLFVSTAGKFHVCEKVGEACHIGDVHNGVEIVRVNDMVRKYIEISEANCLNCWGVRLCGQCFVFARKGSQFDENRKKEHCQARLQDLHDELVTYVSIMEKNSHAFDFVKDMVIK